MGLGGSLPCILQLSRVRKDGVSGETVGWIALTLSGGSGLMEYLKP